MKTTKIFIEELLNLFGNKYDYSKIEYVNSKTKVCVICPIHGEFYATPHNLLKKRGCPKCVGKYKTTEEFIKQSQEIHNNKYDYSKTEYKNANDKIIIICPIHGEFTMSPNKHLMGCGCPKCVGKYKTTEEFIKQLQNIFGDKYDYSKVKYVNAKTKVCVICPKHGEFYTTPSNLLKKSGCPKCTNKKMFNGDDFIKLAQSVHNNKYDYSKVDYINARTKVCIICPIHGEFWQRPSDHIKNQSGCQLCNESKLEKEIQTVLNAYHIIFERQKRFKWLGKQSLDFYLPKYNIAIECQGLQHFRPIDFFGGIKGFKKIIENDQHKWDLTQYNGLQLLYYTNLKKKPSNYFGKIYNDCILLIENILAGT